MKRFTLIFTFIVLFASPLLASEMGSSYGYNLDELWEKARQQYTLAEHDGILLLESQRVTLLPDGRIITRTHRVVWIGSARGIRQYADLRVPFNSETSRLNVLALRTWRDGVWWPDAKNISKTAVVETLPHAVALADDYTTMRETMLLHDGVELPCIMETVYEIDFQGSPDHGADGLFVFPQQDVAVLVELVMVNQSRRKLQHVSGNGAPEIRAVGDRKTWSMEMVDRIGVPRITDPAAFAPYLNWSTWPDWNSLAEAIVGSFDSNATLDSELADTIAARLVHTTRDAASARTVATFVNETTRSIHYNSRYWGFSPRSATQTWETAYGHRFDRAILAAALFRAAGLTAQPVFRSVGLAGIDLEVPGLARFEQLAVLVRGDNGLDLYYNPDDGSLINQTRPLFGRTVWLPAVGENPDVYPGGSIEQLDSRYDLTLTLEPDGDKGWTGTGYLFADGMLSPYGTMTDLDGTTKAVLNRIAGSVLDGCSVEGFNPEIFEPERISIGFNVKIAEAETDDSERLIFGIGIPDGGINDNLPADLHLYDGYRETPVLLPGTMTQNITLRIKTEGRELVHLPRSRQLANDVGSCTVTTGKDQGWVTVELVLSLENAVIGPESWAQLRALLLEASGLADRTVLLK